MNRLNYEAVSFRLQLAVWWGHDALASRMDCRHCATAGLSTGWRAESNEKRLMKSVAVHFFHSTCAAFGAVADREKQPTGGKGDGRGCRCPEVPGRRRGRRAERPDRLALARVSGIERNCHRSCFQRRDAGDKPTAYRGLGA